MATGQTGGGEHPSRMKNQIWSPPQKRDITWDGVVERVELTMPAPTGPMIDLSATSMVPIHTRQGCYNHRGRLSPDALT